MSHIVEIDPAADKSGGSAPLRSLSCLEKAAARCGLELVRGQTTYRSWATDHQGRLVGDWPLPKGMKLEDVGKCDHAIRIPGAAGTGSSSYEIGVIRNQDGGYRLAFDFWGGALEKKAGKRCQNLVRYYQVEANKAVARLNGYHKQVEKVLEDGSIVIDTYVEE